MGMPGFAGQGSQEFAFAAGSVIGYRWWCMNAPDLQSDPFSADKNWPFHHLKGQTGQYVWVDGINVADCNTYGNLHQAPDEACSSGCGFWAYWSPPEQPHFNSEQLWFLGVIKGFGRTLIGSEGFRCEKAQIVALNLASTFELVIRPGDDQGWYSGWSRVFSQPGTHRPPHGRPLPPLFSKRPPAATDREIAEGTARMQTWQAVIEDRLEQTYPGARIIAGRRALLALYPPGRNRVQAAGR